ncbi:DUF4817 domain-containing protein [Trichonephila clavipes]|uniref:DUF4817 domain-containing protein n=1 Tax=Trichonephila clavipes TaxID=2585209 RepID=A0A8X6T2F1_TRICX|nr:DUF4817 domain-containing protein [Trichonephila clavipes]
MLRKNFCVKFQERLDVNGFENTLVFTDEATFHLCGKVNCHNLRFWGTENVHVALEHQRDSPKPDGAPPHWNKNVREFLNKRLPHRWIGTCWVTGFDMSSLAAEITRSNAL